jgi:hypothetical protein
VQSKLDIITPASSTSLTTLARVKSELRIKTSTDDALLTSKIGEASSDIQLALGWAVASEGVQETYWHEHRQQFGYGFGWRSGGHQSESLILRRKAVSAITSVTVDDTVLDPSEYRLDVDAGILYRIDTLGYPCLWLFCKSIIVLYTAGYILPGSPGSNLPASIEGATVDLVESFWLSRGRDPLIKSEEITGIRRVDYWVGTVGDPEQLPPDVLRRISPLRRPRMAVA